MYLVYTRTSNELNEPSSWSLYTALVACVGVGNVSQLACDLLIHTLHLKPIAALYFQSLPAVVGANPYSNRSTAPVLMASQVYVNHNLHLVVFQMRAPPFPGYQRTLIREFSIFLNEFRYKRLILLSSSFATQRKDAELTGSPVRYSLTPDYNHADRDVLAAQNWTPLSPNHKENTSSLDKIQSPVTHHLRGCGIATRLFDQIGTVSPVCLINTFASEGDNIGDALHLLHRLSLWLDLLPEVDASRPTHEVWHPPPSWSMLYGTRLSTCLY